MARIRTVKPETFTSESIAALSLAARWTFVGLWTHVDDEGRARDNAKIIRGAIWPNDEETVTSRDVGAHLVELELNNMICRYVGADGNRYLHVINFGKHQVINRPTKSKLPECSRSPHGGITESSSAESMAENHAPEASNAIPGTDSTPSMVLDTSTASKPSDLHKGQSPSTHGIVSEPSVPEQGTGNREQGKGTGTLSLNSPMQPPLLALVENEPLAPLAESPSDLFDEFWKAYPRSVGKAKAKTTFATKAKNGADAHAIVAAARSYADRCRTTKQDPQFIPHPTTWLNRESWTDDLDASLPLPQAVNGGYQPYQNRPERNYHGSI